MNGVVDVDVSLKRMNVLLTDVYRSIIKVEEVMLFRLSDGQLTLSEMHMLESIGKCGGQGITITDIAQDLEITPPSVTAMVKRLERKGFISKDRSDEDARRVHVLLTDKGRRAEIAYRYFQRNFVRDLTDALNIAEKEAIVTALEKIDAYIRRQIGEYSAGKED